MIDSPMSLHTPRSYDHSLKIWVLSKNQTMLDALQISLSKSGVFSFDVGLAPELGSQSWTEERPPSIVMVDVQHAEGDSSGVDKLAQESRSLSKIRRLFPRTTCISVTLESANMSSVEHGLSLGCTGHLNLSESLLPSDIDTQLHLAMSAQAKISGLMQRCQELQHQSQTDALTGLYNRRFFDVKIRSHLGGSKRHGQPLSLIILDINGFKQINDRFGHLLGDQVLCELSRTLIKSSRVDDTICRIGGDEFALLLPMTDSKGAAVVAERIHKRLEELKLAVTNGGRLRIEASMGIATMRAKDDAESLFSRADDSLYHSKIKSTNVAAAQ